jgi:hypothetical protein
MRQPIYQISASGKVTGQTNLNTKRECNPYILLGDHILTVGSFVNLFKFPQGGGPVKTISRNLYQQIAVSPGISQ